VEISDPRAGDIVLAVLTQRDGILKPRPTLLLRSMPPFGDFLACGLSSRLYQEARGFDEILEAGDGDFKASGLLRPSLIRLGWLSTIPLSQMKGGVGSITPQRLERLLRRLANYVID
jgi:mRNA interferase MazF